MKKGIIVGFLVALTLTIVLPSVKEALAETIFLPNKFTIDSDGQSEVLAASSIPTYQNVNYNVEISGQVGIGTAPSSYKLEIATASGITNTRIGTTGGGRLYLGNRGYYIEDDLLGSDLGFVAPSLYTATTSASPWRKICTEGDTTCSGVSLPAGSSGQTLRHDGASWLANSNLYNNGTNIGIGTTSPGAKLQINPPASTEGLRIISAADWSPLNIRNSGNTTDLFRVDQSGNVIVSSLAGSGTRMVTADTNGQMSTQAIPTAAVPTGAVMFFNLAACPSGWTELTSARGRTIVGLPLSGTLAGTQGTALTNLGTRTITQVPSHTHTVNPPATSTDSQGAHTHGFGLTNDGTGPNSVRGDMGTSPPTTIFTQSGGAHTHSVDIAQFNSGSTGVASVDVTMPYIQLLTCQKL